VSVHQYRSMFNNNIIRVYFRISLKRGQTHSSKLQGGQMQIQGGGHSHIKYRER
jgi:hypothetical protein